MTKSTKKRRKPSLTVITHSEVQSYRDCAQKWHFAYAERLRPIATSPALSFGTAIHAGLAAGYMVIAAARMRGVDASLSETIEASERATLGVREAWETSSRDASSEAAEEAQKSVDTALWMIRHYWSRMESDLRNLIPLGVEVGFSVPMLNDVGKRIQHLVLAGVIDLVAYDVAAGDLVIFDHKTTSGEVSQIDRRVEMDPQLAGYLWALREYLRQGKSGLLTIPASLRGLGEQIARGDVPTGRVAYNVLRKRIPRVPDTTQKGLVSTAAIDTLPGVYLEALQAQEQRGLPITDAQRELLAKLEGKGDAFLSRREYFRTPEEIERWRREAYLDGSRIRLARLDPALVTRNPGHCSSPWSMPCSYRSVCLDPHSPELRTAFRVAGEAHEEVAQATKSDEAVPF